MEIGRVRARRPGRSPARQASTAPSSLSASIHSKLGINLPAAGGNPDGGPAALSRGPSEWTSTR